jgi:drug/metabolite transporter (DMT)-like permease
VRVPAAFTGIILVWSTTPLAIQWSSEGGGFLFGVTARMLLGLVFCLLAVGVSGSALPWHARARSAYLVAGGSIFAAMTLVYWGAQYVPSGWIAVVFGLSPLFTGLFSMLWLSGRRFTWPEAMGLLLGVCGLVVIFSGGAGTGPHVGMGVAAVLASTLIHSASSVWVKRLTTDLPALAVTAGGLIVAVPVFGLAWLVFDGIWPAQLPGRAQLAIIYLALIGSVLGFFLYFYLLRQAGPVKVNLTTLITPVMALLLGHWLNGEALLASVWTGTLLVLSGLSIYQWQSARSG